MHKTIKASAIAALSLLAFASQPALAQSGIGAGDKELSFFGSLSNNSDMGTDVTVGFARGRFWTDNLQFRFNQVISVSESDGESTILYFPYASLEYQLRVAPDSPFLPYVGGGLGMFIMGSEAFSAYGLYLTPVAGVKYFVSERTSLEYGFSYQIPMAGEICDDIDCYDATISTVQNTIRLNIYY